MNTDEKLAAYRDKLAEQNILTIEWCGDDYGKRKRYYADCFKHGFDAGMELGKLLALKEMLSVYVGAQAEELRRVEENIDALLEGKDD